MDPPSRLEPGCYLMRRLAIVVAADHVREAPAGSEFQVLRLLVVTAGGGAQLIADALPSDSAAWRPPCS